MISLNAEVSTLIIVVLTHRDLLRYKTGTSLLHVYHQVIVLDNVALLSTTLLWVLINVYDFMGNMLVFVQKNAFKYVVNKMVAISSKP